MFELEKAITEWRKQMQAAGIITSVPLEELELHLREDIDRLVKSGLNQETAFGIASRHLGQPQVLKNEFKKNGILAGKKMPVITLAFAAVMILRVLQVHHRSGPPWHGDQVEWIFSCLLASFWAANAVFFNFNLGSVREVRLWKLVPIIYSMVAVWISLLPILRFYSAFSTTELILAFAAAVACLLSVFAWRSGRQVLPIIRDRRTRTLIGIACGLCGPGLIALFICFGLPRPAHFPAPLFYVLMAWGWTAMAVLGGTGYGLAEAACERKPLNQEKYV